MAEDDDDEDEDEDEDDNEEEGDEKDDDYIEGENDFQLSAYMCSMSFLIA